MLDETTAVAQLDEVDAAISASIAGVSIFLVRLAAIKWGLNLPVFGAK